MGVVLEIEIMWGIGTIDITLIMEIVMIQNKEIIPQEIIIELVSQDVTPLILHLDLDLHLLLHLPLGL